MIRREKCLEWASDALYSPSVTNGGGYDGLIEAIINRAYQEGQKDMRERAANKLKANGWLEQAAEVIKNLEIE